MTLPEDRLLQARLAALADGAQPSPDGWERIEARARRHDRRRRVGVAATLAVALVLAAVVAWSRLGGRGYTAGVAVSTPPSVTAPQPATAATGAGPAAWVSGGQLWLSPGSGPPHPVAGSSPAADPAWSPDGRWVSYLHDPGSAATQLRVVHPDGTGNVVLWTGTPGGIEWSPTSDQVAVSDAPSVGVGGLEIVAPGRSPHRIVTAALEVNSFSWSPDGASIAYSSVIAPAATYRSPLNVVTLDGASAGTTRTILAAAAGDGIAVGPWWPDGTGLLYWIEPQYSRATEAAGLLLMSTGLTGSPPVSLTTTLVSLPWLAWARDGRILVVRGGGQLPSDDKTLTLCSPTTGACTPVPTPAGTVALDPSWSPDGRQLAFVVARQSATADATWYSTRRLWVADIDDLAAAHRVAGAAAGAALPSWSGDSQTLRYSTATDVETVPATGGTPVVVSGSSALRGNDGLDGETAFGKAAWAGHAVWAP